MVRAWLVPYLLVVLLWGGAYGLTEVALTAFSAGQVALWRAILGAGCLLLMLVVTGEGLPRLGSVRTPRILLLAGLTTTAFICATEAQQRMSSGMVAVLCATTPLFAVLLDRLSGNRTAVLTWIGVLLGMAGVAVLLSPNGEIDVIAVTLSLAAAGLLALAGFLAGTFFAGAPVSGSQLTMTQLSFSGLLLLPIASHGPAATAEPSLGPVLALLVLGVLCAAVGNILFWRVLREAGFLVATTTYQTVPLVAVFVGIVALGESLDLGEVIGAGLILTGLTALLLGKRTPTRRRQARGCAPAHTSRRALTVTRV